MAAKQKTRYAILGLLSWKPMSGYDIKKVVDVGLSHFWNENFGQIYPTLESLVSDELATKQEQGSQGKRKRFVYSITGKGRRAFKTWLKEPTAMPVVRNELQLKFFLSCNLPPAETIRLIRAYQTDQKALLDEYQRSATVLRAAMNAEAYPEELDEILQITSSKPSQRAAQCKVFYLTLRQGILSIQARLSWCDEVAKSLKE
ncbi:MAG: PadR family transcriptional regulator [Planctomycetota bacterium]